MAKLSLQMIRERSRKLNKELKVATKRVDREWEKKHAVMRRMNKLQAKCPHPKKPPQPMTGILTHTCPYCFKKWGATFDSKGWKVSINS